MGKPWKAAMVFVAGPIKYWWTHWSWPEHEQYGNWRQYVADALVAAGYTTYCPHTAIRGPWDERFQAINDIGIQISDVMVNLTPPGVVSQGTDGEMAYAANYDKTVIMAPPPDNIEQGVARLLRQLYALGLKTPAAMQTEVLQSFPLGADKGWLLRATAEEFRRYTLRLHYLNSRHISMASDVATIYVETNPDGDRAIASSVHGETLVIPLSRINKVEVLALTVPVAEPANAPSS